MSARAWIVAFKLEADDPSRYEGPPYAVAETMFAEDDFAGCAVDAQDVEGTVS